MLKLEKLEKYVKEATDLVVEPYEHGLVVSGSFGKFSLSLTITNWSDSSTYSCKGGVYVKEDYSGVELVEVSKTLKSEEEIINLIDKSITTANKLSVTLCTLERELNE